MSGGCDYGYRESDEVSAARSSSHKAGYERGLTERIETDKLLKLVYEKGKEDGRGDLEKANLKIKELSQRLAIVSEVLLLLRTVNESNLYPIDDKEEIKAAMLVRDKDKDKDRSWNVKYF